jgi:hypothetical protein
MSDSWEKFVTNVVDDGRARSYMFEWMLPPIEFLLSDANLKLTSATFPGCEIEELTRYWQGSQYKCGGSRRFNDWSVTLMCDNTSLKNLRFLFEVWSSEINFVGAPGAGTLGSLFDFDTSTFYYGNPNLMSGGYYRTQILQMLDDKGSVTQRITLVDSWPKSIGDISLSRDSSDFAQFDVTFAYNSSYVIPI